MSKIEKNCHTCFYAYDVPERVSSGREILRQHCRSAAFNSPFYTIKHLLEDWDLGHCRFWSPRRVEPCRHV